MRMQAAVVVGVLTAMGAGTAGADSSTPGTPGAPNCHGQTIAYYAHIGKDVDQIQRERGIGQLAAFSEITVGETQQIAADSCTVAP